ncbi:MAG TPA: FAD-dependent oxidoreductase [Verrucomicrobiae bacterium]|jgi:protoporphyrinogen oxidase|nr:FAD-dependent oxidoreductase [Verrucomicrobiae bacterium]
MKKLRVAIIGAGPSGFSVAEVLRSERYADYFDVVMYERNGYVGGKCCTVFDDGSICNDKPGGYEMGAALLSKHTPSYKDLKDIIEKYDVKTTPFREANRTVFSYVKRGKHASMKYLSWAYLRRSPPTFLHALKGYDEYALDYLKYAGSLHAGYTNRPPVLSKRLSRLYTKEVSERLAGIMQGFGYADMEDRHLTPALLYYHQYIEPGVFEYPIYKLDNGMQGIWAKIAATYPTGTIRLNQEVTRINRMSNAISVTTPDGTEIYDYVVIATPLKPALQYLDLDHEQKQFLSRMQHNHYVSVLCRASGLEANGTFNIEACYSKKRLGRVVFGYKRYPDSDYITAYLYVKKGGRSDDKSIVKVVAKSLHADMGAELVDSQHAKVFHWQDYFGHLRPKDIRAGWYDDFERYFQGKDRTLFVSSGLHMETVGASVQFGTQEAKKYAKIWARL